MSEERRSVFVSATSSDLGGVRTVARDALLEAGIFPVVQDHFPPDYRSLIEFLRKEIAGCDAVICIVGHVLGACPSNLPGPRRSYTQLEYDIGRELGKPVYVLLQQHGPDGLRAQADEDRALQLRHRDDLCDHHKCEWFDSPDEARARLIGVAALIRERRATPLFFLNKPPLPRTFVGREQELGELSKAVEDPRPPIGVVVGMGGQGKTTLLAHFLREQPRLPFAAVIWCTAHETKASFETFLDEALTRLLGDDFDKRQHPDTSSRARRLVSALQERPILLVLDSVERWLKGWLGPGADEGDSVEARTGAVEGLDDLLQEAGSLTNGSQLLLTSRALPAVLDDVEYTSIPAAHAPGSEERLPGLGREAGVALLQSLGVQAEQTLLCETVEELAFHPLALTLLAGIVRKKYGGHLERVDRERAVGQQRRLTALFEEARASLPGGESADRFLRVVAHSLGDLPIAALEPFAEELDELDSRELAVSLSDWNLLEWDADFERVSLHPLTQRYFAGLADAAESRDINVRLSEWHAQRPVPATARSLEDVNDRIRAIEHAVRGGASERCVDLVFDPVDEHYPFVQWLAQWGHQTTGIRLLDSFVDDLPGGDRSYLLNARAALRRQVGRLDEAIVDLDMVVEELGERLPELGNIELVQLAGVLINRGNVRRQLFRLDDSLADFERALSTLRQLPDDDETRREREADLLLNRGSAFRESGEYTQGLNDFLEAAGLYLDLIRAGRDELRADRATCLANLGNVHTDLGLHDKAARNFEEAIEEHERLLQAGREELAAGLNHARLGRAVAMAETGLHDEALSIMRAVLSEYERLQAEGQEGMALHRGLAHMAAEMALIEKCEWPMVLSECDAAIALFEDLKDQGQSLVDGWLAHTLIDRSAALHGLQRFEEAMQGRRAGLELIREHLTDAEPETRVLYLKRAAFIACYVHARDPVEAQDTLQAAVAEAEKGVAGGRASEALRLASSQAGIQLGFLAEDGHRGLLDRLEALATAT